MSDLRKMTDEELKELPIIELSKEEQIYNLKEELTRYDYIGIKIAMGVATKEEYAKEITYTQELRNKINELEN